MREYPKMSGYWKWNVLSVLCGHLEGKESNLLVPDLHPRLPHLNSHPNKDRKVFSMRECPPLAGQVPSYRKSSYLGLSSRLNSYSIFFGKRKEKLEAKRKDKENVTRKKNLVNRSK